MTPKNFQERRSFLKQATAFALASGCPRWNTLTKVAHAAGGVGTTEVGADYKAIVCVFLYGGQDHSNVLIPLSRQQWHRHHRIRPLSSGPRQ